MDLMEASIRDLDLLTRMNIELRADEKMDNAMTDEEVRNRMKGFLEGNVYKTFILKQDKTAYGYALLDITRKPVYLRQLFIGRQYRNKGYGKILMRKVMEKLNIRELDIEVMTWNEDAIRFYENFGFRRRYIGLRYKE